LLELFFLLLTEISLSILIMIFDRCQLQKIVISHWYKKVSKRFQ